MKRIIVSIILVTSMLFMGACGKSENNSQQASNEASVESSAEESTVETSQVDTESTTTQEEETEDDAFSELDAIGDVDVDKGLFNVTITVPSDFIGETTQDEIDQTVKEKGYKSGTLNDDGSVTYVMNKEQHNELMVGIKESIDTSLAEMVGSENTPNITEVKANDDYTSFTITTKNTEPDLTESFSVLGLYMYGGMYAIFNGETVDNIHVDFVNADTGEIISSSNSADMDDSQ